MFVPELLSPAGTLKGMRYAFAYGADAVYAGQPRYSLRVRNNEFNKIENLEKAIAEAHDGGKKFYLASNISPHNDKIRSYIRDLEPVIAMKPDALIMADPGLIMMVKDRWPEQEVHLSVQANAVNWASVKFWGRQGISRVILSRELSLGEIEEIRNQCPEMELEVFVHGALCIAYSGRCLLSGYMTHRDPNQGACTNSCRWKYDVKEAKETTEGGVVHMHQPEPAPDEGKVEGIEDRIFLIEEENRPGEYMPAFEDEHGTYIMNSKDLRAVQHVAKLTELGVHSLKIEGRTKSAYYAARTAQVYRRAIDDAVKGKAFDFELMRELDGLANRGYTEGFYRRHVPKEYQSYDVGHSAYAGQQFVGEIMGYDDQRQELEIDVRNRFATGDVLTLLSPSGNVSLQAEALMKASTREPMDVAPGSGHVVRLPVSGLLREGFDPNHALLVRNLPDAS